MGRKREFIRAAAPTAAPTPPPCPRIASEANCAEPAKTIAEKAMAASAGIPASRASTPNDTPTTAAATATGTPARSPARHDRRSAAFTSVPARAGGRLPPPASGHFRARLRSVPSSAQGRVFPTCAGVSQARRAVAMP